MIILQKQGLIIGDKFRIGSSESDTLTMIYRETANTMNKIVVTTTLCLLALLVAACTPTVQIAIPNEPITINLNVRIEHEIRIQVEEELDGIFTLDSGLF